MRLMRPCRLERAAARVITRTLLDRVRDLCFTWEHDREPLVEALWWLGPIAYNHLLSLVLQKELNCVLEHELSSEECLIYAEVNLLCMLALCREVTVELHTWKLSKICSDGMLEVLGMFQKKLSMLLGMNTSVGGEGEGERGDKEGKDDAYLEKTGRMEVDEEEGRAVNRLAPLHTQSLEFMYIGSLDDEFLPRLVEKMPGLKKFVITIDTYRKGITKTLSQNCRELQVFYVSMMMSEIPHPFGVPDYLITEDLIQKFCEGGEEFRRKFVPLFPELRCLEVGGLKKSLRILSLVHCPKLEKLDTWTLDELRTFCQVWNAAYGSSSGPPVLPVKYTHFSREQCHAMNQPESEELMHLFHNLRCLLFDDGIDFSGNFRLVENEEDLSIVENIIRMFSSSLVNAMFLPDLPFSDLSILAHLQHLLIIGNNNEVPVLNKIHIILDCCPLLCTLSLNQYFVEDSFLMDEPYHRGHTPHTNLTSLRINSCIDTEYEPIETFFYYLLRRVPLLRRLCISTTECQDLAVPLQSMLTEAALNDTPLLTHLEELCCLPTCTKMWTIDDIKATFTLIQSLPALCCLTLPKPSFYREINKDVEKFLARSLNVFQRTDLEFKDKCNIEQVFFIRDSHSWWG